MIERITRRSPSPTTDKPTRRDPRTRDAAVAQEASAETSISRLARVDVHAEAKFRLRREAREKAAAPATAVSTDRKPERLDPRTKRSSRLRPDLTLENVEAPAAADNILRLESPATHIFVVTVDGESWSGGEREMLGGARQIADGIAGAAVTLLRIGAAQPDCDAGAAGADRLWHLAGTDTSPETAVALVLGAISSLAPRHVIFADGSAGGDIARRVAAALNERPAVGLQKIGDQTVISRGNGGRSDFTRPMPRILLAAPGLFDPVENQPPREARAIEMDLPVPEPSRIRDLGPEEMSVANVPLSEADFIVSAGDGITDWPGFFDVAAALSGVIGGSRQVCDAGLLPRHRQVGASGTLVEAKVYLALGISGAPQHLQGIQRCRFVAAVNTDLHAAMIKRADLAIIADAQEVMPELALIARERRHVG